MDGPVDADALEDLLPNADDNGGPMVHEPGLIEASTNGGSDDESVLEASRSLSTTRHSSGVRALHWPFALCCFHGRRSRDEMVTTKWGCPADG
jgi:hypothetical protein